MQKGDLRRIPRGFRPKTREDLTVVELDGEAVVYEAVSGSLHHLNPTATIIFSLCDGSSTLQQVANEVATVFQLQQSEVLAQIEQLIGQLVETDLLEPAGASSDGRGRKNGRQRQT